MHAQNITQNGQVMQGRVIYSLGIMCEHEKPVSNDVVLRSHVQCIVIIASAQVVSHVLNLKL